MEPGQDQDLTRQRGASPADGERPSAWTGLLTFLAVLVLLLAASILLALAREVIGRWALLLAEVCLILIPTLAAVRLSGGSMREDLLLRPLAPLAGLVAALTPLASLPLLSMLLLFLRRVIPGADELERDLTETIRADGPWQLALVLLVAAVAPAVCEEVLFRGWILSLFRRSLSPGTAIVGQAALFGILHGHPVRFLPTMALGVLLGWMAWRTKSLLAPILGHGFFNAAIVLLAQVGDTDSGETAILMVFAASLVLFPTGCFLLDQLTRAGEEREDGAPE